MNYTALFNFLYSTEISEATKAEVIDKIGQPIEESYEVQPLVETYMELLDTLVYSTASEALIYNIIDETFSQLDEAFINEVSDEWIKRKTEAGLKQREQAHKAAQDSVKSGVIGLSQLNRQAATKAKLDKGRAQVAARTPQATETPKAESGATGKLKSAVGKVKSWAEKKSPMHGSKDVASLSRLIGYKANKDNIGAETLRQQTTHKGAEAPKNNDVKAEVKGAEAPVNIKQKMEDLRKKFDRTDRSKSAPSTIVDSIKAWKKAIDHNNKLQNRKEKPVQQKLDLKIPKSKVQNNEVRAEKINKVKVTAKDNVKDNSKQLSFLTPTGRVKKQYKQPEAPKVDKATEEVIKSVKKKIANTISKRSSKGSSKKTPAENIAASANKGTSAAGKRESGRKGRITINAKGRSKVTTNEALSELALMLLTTNISESCYVEVMEMVVASKANADKVKKKLDKEKTEAMNDLYKDVEAGKPENPETLKKLDNIGKREERFNAIYKKKFNNNP